jgi:hypothetical protein
MTQTTDSRMIQHWYGVNIQAGEEYIHHFVFTGWVCKYCDIVIFWKGEGNEVDYIHPRNSKFTMWQRNVIVKCEDTDRNSKTSRHTRKEIRCSNKMSRLKQVKCKYTIARGEYTCQINVMIRYSPGDTGYNSGILYSWVVEFMVFLSQTQ